MNHDNNTTVDEDLVADLVIAMLSVNNWPLEKSYAIREQLRKEGLFNISRLSGMNRADVCNSLYRAGYLRADYILGLLADRLLDMATTLSGNNLIKLRSFIERGEIKEADSLLLNIKGVGPMVLENFKILAMHKS